MLFTSSAFFIFFAIYFVLQSTIPSRYQIPLIILGGTIFYGYWNPLYTALPYFLIFVGFVGAKSLSDGSRKSKLTATVVILVLPLLFFKYAHFLGADVLGLPWTSDLKFGLPLGISFISFTMIAYVVDVYRGVFPVEREPSSIAGMILFFPHSIAGPILRQRDLIPQLSRPQGFDPKVAYWGFALFTVGLVKKVVLADQLAEFVNPVFSSGGIGFTPFQQLLATYSFTVQLYADFSGYTDMAIGCALILGYQLPINFDRPYLSKSLIEFWRRWHITLSNWLRDYLYIPLGGNRRGLWRQLLALMITMLLGGLWHGANWTFIIWGALHGTALAMNVLIRRFRTPRLPIAASTFLTFQLVAFGWIFFRSENVQDACHVLHGTLTAYWPTHYPVHTEMTAAAFPIFLIGLFFSTHAWDNHEQLKRFLFKTPVPIAGALLLGLWVLAYALAGGSLNSSTFIYFDF